MTKKDKNEKEGSDENNEQSELKMIKQLLIAQLVLSGASIRDIEKITGMGTYAIYKFLPKNLGEKKLKKEKNNE
ncbi:hypothetical protein [Nitrosopumilus sp.]|uniref:hypothetical protein n=1 Tax=Nitrosopumilus sp. TaxID=2024843 RepID=UPI003D14225D